MIKTFIRALIIVKNFISYRKSLWFNLEIKKLDIFLKIQSF